MFKYQQKKKSFLLKRVQKVLSVLNQIVFINRFFFLGKKNVCSKKRIVYYHDFTQKIIDCWLRHQFIVYRVRDIWILYSNCPLVVRKCKWRNCFTNINWKCYLLVTCCKPCFIIIDHGSCFFWELLKFYYWNVLVNMQVICVNC